MHNRKQAFYDSLNPEKYFDVPGCLQMILYKRNLPFIGHDEIRRELGLKVIKSESRTPYAKVVMDKYALNRFFKSSNLPLKESYHHPNDLKDIPSFIAENLAVGNDLLACYTERRNGVDLVSLVRRLKGKVVQVVDPAQGIRNEPLDFLVNDMIRRGKDNLGGFWVISSI